MTLRSRVATLADLPVLMPLIDAAITRSQKGFLDDAQIASSKAEELEDAAGGVPVPLVRMRKTLTS